MNGGFEALRDQGRRLAQQGRAGEAVGCFQQALALNPRDPQTLHDLGRLLQGLGRLDEAERAFEAAAALEPQRGEHHRRLAEVVRFKDGDPRLEAMERLAAQAGPADQISLLFALGKAYADLGRHAASFQHFQKACGLVRKRIAYDEAGTLGMFRRMAQLFTPELMQAKAGLGDPSETPIFILGMPRSGSTLVEQILAAHPDVVGAGELAVFRDIAATALGEPERVRGLDATGFRAIGGRYLQMVRTLGPKARRITDKMPANFLMIGLIRLALPNARIIHTVRDPVDTCLSCFTTLFGDGQLYSYELGEVGRHYQAYSQLMDHWQAVLPPGGMLEVRYEDVVADLEGQARRLLDHCGLTWDERCLEFDRTERAVWTASAVQVRSPLYRSSIGHWRPGSEVIRPLVEALGPLAGTDRRI